MQRNVERLGRALFLLLLVAETGSAQRPPADLVGIMRQDGIAVPHFEWRNGTWAPVEFHSLPLIPSLLVRDSTGRADRYSIEDTVTVNDGYDFRGWQTQMPEPAGMSRYFYPVPRVGYVVSRAAGDAPFRHLRINEGEPLREAIVAALLATGDTILAPVVVDAWEATLGATQVVFFEVGSGPGAIGCLSTITSGWYRADWDAPVVATRQVGDCEKGVQRRTPWALLERSEGFYGHVALTGWEGAEHELWSLEGGASRLAVVP